MLKLVAEYRTVSITSVSWKVTFRWWRTHWRASGWTSGCRWAGCEPNAWVRATGARPESSLRCRSHLLTPVPGRLRAEATRTDPCRLRMYSSLLPQHVWSLPRLRTRRTYKSVSPVTHIADTMLRYSDVYTQMQRKEKVQNEGKEDWEMLWQLLYTADSLWDRKSIHGEEMYNMRKINV